MKAQISKLKSQNFFLFLFALIAFLLAIAGRFMPHLPNFTPVGAFALFAGVYLARKYWWAMGLPLAAMFLSDLFIGFYDWKLMAVVYASFLGYSAIGFVVSKRKNPATIVLASICGAFLFYLTTNFAVWALSSYYPHTLGGLMLSYTLALPFFRATLLGDLFFAGILFGAYELGILWSGRAELNRRHYLGKVA